MNAEELQTFDKKTRRRLFAWEVLAAIDKGTLKESFFYFGHIPVDDTCHSCAIGAAYVFYNGWKNCSGTDDDRKISIEYMKKMGFSRNQIDAIEYSFEELMRDIDANDSPITSDYKYTKLILNKTYPDRLDRIRVIYQHIFDNKQGEFLPMEEGE